MTEANSEQLLSASCVRAEAAGSIIATFVFSVVDADAVRRLIEHMYLEFDVCAADDDGIAYTFCAPDRRVGPWVLPINADDLGLIEETQRLLNTCPTFIRGERGEPIGLADYAMDLDHDYSGRYAKARRAFEDGRADEARAGLEALIDENPEGLHHARRLLARCHVAAGNTAAAIEALRGAVRIAHLSTGFRLHPAASTSLYELAVLYSKEGRPGAAAACLLHALELRPNFPEALLMLGSMFPKEDELVEHILARIIALGGRDDEAKAWAEKNGVLARFTRANELASAVVQSMWPYGGPDFGSPEHIELVLNAPEAPPKPPKPTAALYRKLSPFSDPSTTVVAGATGEGGAAGGLSTPLRVAVIIGAVIALLVVAYMIYTSMAPSHPVG